MGRPACCAESDGHRYPVFTRAVPIRDDQGPHRPVVRYEHRHHRTQTKLRRTCERRSRLCAKATRDSRNWWRGMFGIYVADAEFRIERSRKGRLL